MSDAARQGGGTGVEPSGEFGVFIFLASEGLLFGALVLAYFVARLQHGAEFAGGSEKLNLVLGTANTIILLTSSFAVALATIWADGKAIRKARRALLVTAGLGFAFIGIKAFEWWSEAREGLLPGYAPQLRYPVPDIPELRLFFDIYLTLTGTHAVHLLSGVGLVLFIAARWQRLHRPEHVLRLAALYWHFVDVVWVFLFPMLYLVR